MDGREVFVCPFGLEHEKCSVLVQPGIIFFIILPRGGRCGAWHGTHNDGDDMDLEQLLTDPKMRFLFHQI